MKYTNANESQYLDDIAGRTGQTALQIRRMLALPDLSRTTGSPVYYIRITYRSHIRTLTTDEINSVQESLRLRVVEEFGAVLR